MTPWEQILKTAVRAPSPLNTQPWKLEMHNEVEATLYIDSSRRPPELDAYLHLTMGLFLECLSIVANNEGWTLQDEPIDSAETSGLIPFSRLTLKPGVQRKNLYSNAILHRRRTSRLSHQPVPIAPEAAQRLEETANDWEQALTWLTDSAQIDKIIQLHTLTVSQNLNQLETRAERRKWFRYTLRQARLRGDGIDARSIGVGFWRYWTLTRMPFLMRWGWVQKLYRRKLGHVQTVAVLSGPFGDRATSVRAGRFLMRFWLEATRLDLVLHPLSNLTNDPAAKEVLREDLRQTGIWFVFRIGKTAVPPPSFRLREAEILQKSQ